MIASLTAAIFPPLIAVYVANRLRPDPAAEIALYALTFIATIALSVFFDKWEPLMGLGQVGDRLRLKLRGEGISIEKVEDQLVGFGPDEDVRISVETRGSPQVVVYATRA